MRPHRFLFALGLLAADAAIAAPAPTSDLSATPSRELVIVVEDLGNEPGAAMSATWFEQAFQQLAKERHWPVHVVTERVSATTANHPLELRIADKGISTATPGELSYSVWMTLTDRGTQHDLGILRFNYHPHLTESADSTNGKLYGGIARLAAEKIEPLLAPPPPAELAPERPDLVLVVVESLEHSRGAITDFDRLDLALHRVVAERKWPVNFLAERFAANSSDHAIELRVYNQTIREDLPGERMFRGWVTLTANGAKHDFGIVTFRYYSRPGEDHENMVDAVFRGAANAMADRVEPILFPKAPAAKAP